MGTKKGGTITQPHVIAGRINVLFKAIISGTVLDTYRLREISVINGWMVGDRQLVNYRKKALKKFEELAEIDLKKETGIAKARYQFLYNQGVVKNQLKVALTANDRLCTLQGLNAAEKIEISGPKGRPLLDGITKSELIDIIGNG